MRHHTQSTLFVQSPALTVTSVLDDVERYQQWLPEVERSRLLAREGGTSVVEIRAPRFADDRLLFEIERVSDHARRFRQVGRMRDRGIRGSVSSNEAEDDAGTLVEIAASIAAPVFAFRRRRELARVVAAAGHALDLRVQKAVLGALPTASRRPTRVLAVSRTESGYDVWFEGRTWRLEAANDEEGSEP